MVLSMCMCVYVMQGFQRTGVLVPSTHLDSGPLEEQMSDIWFFETGSPL